MQERLYAIPILPGNTEQVKRNFQEMNGARKDQCEANRAVMGITREYVCLQHLPQGDILIVYLEGEDLPQARQKLTASRSEYARWVAEDVLPLYDADLSHGLPASEVLADWRAIEATVTPRDHYLRTLVKQRIRKGDKNAHNQETRYDHVTVLHAWSRNHTAHRHGTW